MVAGTVALGPHDAGAEPAGALGGDHVVQALDGHGIAAAVGVFVQRERLSQHDGRVRWDPLLLAEAEDAAFDAFGARGWSEIGTEGRRIRWEKNSDSPARSGVVAFLLLLRHRGGCLHRHEALVVGLLCLRSDYSRFRIGFGEGLRCCCCCCC